MSALPLQMPRGTFMIKTKACGRRQYSVGFGCHHPLLLTVGATLGRSFNPKWTW